MHRPGHLLYVRFPPFNPQETDLQLQPLQSGNNPEAEMFRTFNMGIGMVVVVRAEDAEAVQGLEGSAVVLGKVTQGEGVQF